MQLRIRVIPLRLKVILFTKVLILGKQVNHVKTVLSLSIVPCIVAGIMVPVLFKIDSAALLTNTTNESITPATKLKVVSSVAPITNIVKNIGGDRIDL